MPRMSTAPSPGRLRHWVRFGVLGVLLVVCPGCFALAFMSRHGWNDPGDTEHMSQRQFSPAELAALKQSETVFFLKDDDERWRAALEADVRRVWRLTKVLFVPYRERAAYADRGRYSYFVIGGVEKFHSTLNVARPNDAHVSYVNTHFYLTLERSIPDEHGQLEPTTFCRIELYPDRNTLNTSIANGDDNLIPLYAGARFLNWTPPQLALYLTAVQRDLEQSRRRWLFDEFDDDEALKQLKASTLYVPDYTLYKFESGGGPYIGTHVPKELLADYRHRYYVVTPYQLDQLLAAAGDRPIYVFDYVQSSADKFVTIFDSQKGMIHRQYRAMSYQISSGDFDVF